MVIVVSDTSPVRALACLELMDLLGVLFGTVYVPPAVAWELKSPTANLVAVNVQDWAFIRVVAPSNPAVLNRFAGRLDPGETEALALALELKIESILMDEREGRAVARICGFVPIGVLGILVRAKHARRITSVAPLIDQLRDKFQFFLSDAVRDEALRLAGEV